MQVKRFKESHTILDSLTFDLHTN